MKKYVIPYLTQHGFMQSYRATVTAKDTVTKTMTVQRPFDNTSYTLPYSASAANLAVNDQCTVFALGDSFNAIVVSDGAMSTI